MKLMRMIMGQTGSYDQQFFRPYQSDVKDIGVVQSAIEATANGSRLGVGAMAAVANQIIRPSTEVQGAVQIANGWNEQRFQFMLQLDISPRGDGSVGEIISGFTDYVGFYNGHIDPNLKFYFNNSIQLRAVIAGGIGASHATYSITDASQILTGNYNPQFGQNNYGDMTMRPEDVYCVMQHSVADFSGTQIADTRTTFVEPIKKSSRRNNHVPEYLSRLVTGLRGAYGAADGQINDLAEVLDSARDHVVEALISKDHFINYVRSMSGDMARNYVTYQELCMMDPTIGDRVTMAVTGELQRAQLHQVGQTENWSGSNNETIIATAFANGLSSLMMTCGLQSAAFTISNHTIDGSFHYQMVAAHSIMDNVDVASIIESNLMPRLINEVLAPLTYNSSLAVNIQVEARLLSEMRIHVSVGSGPLVPYCLPCFADALVAPVITQDFMQIQTMAKDIDMLYNNINESKYANTGVQQNGHFGTV